MYFYFTLTENELQTVKQWVQHCPHIDGQHLCCSDDWPSITESAGFTPEEVASLTSTQQEDVAVVICAASCCQARLLFPDFLGALSVETLLNSMVPASIGFSELGHAWLADETRLNQTLDELQQLGFEIVEIDNFNDLPIN